MTAGPLGGGGADNGGGSGGAGSGDGGAGMASVGAAGSGIIANVGDSDGDGNGLANVDANLPVGALDGVQVDAITSDSLAEARAPGLLDATVGDGGLTDGLGSGGCALRRY